MFNSIVQKFKYGNYSISIETGIIAKQSTSSVLINANDTTILISIVENNQKFLLNKVIIPLTVNFLERSYASGKFPVNFLRREGRPSENEILISRLIDRSIRPLFDKKYFKELQITVTVISLDPNVNTDVISIIGVSAALSISNIPFKGPIASSKIGYIDNKFILNPSFSELKNSKLDLLISGNKKSITVIESMSNFLDKKTIINAIKFGKDNYDFVIDNIEDFKKNFNNNSINNKISNDIDLSTSLYDLIYEITYDKFNIAYSIENKTERSIEIEKIKSNTINQIINTLSENHNNNILISLNNIEKKIVRNKIIKDKIRLDGRSYDSIRDIYININLLPRVHGSSLFTRGNTQSLVAITLGSEKNGQNINNTNNDNIDNFIFHYNFPPYSVGEIGNLSFPKRREIGHGKLAKRSLIPVIPNFNEFPYAIRVVSEITESDGSSSMASICGASLALMDSGVPIKSHIAGIAMGLIKEGENLIILSDISGYEDYFGDMDIKISGGINGITGIQMDIKIDEITIIILEKIIDKALISINKIIEIMNMSISSPRKILSKFAPKIFLINIDKNKIKDIIGKGGLIIKSIMKDTKSSIDINDLGEIKIYSINDELGKKAICKIYKIAYDLYEGIICKGIIINIINFKIFINLKDKKERFINFSKLDININKYNINNFKIGQEILVKIIEINKYGKIKLSINNLIK